jgi:hypothetical protein
VGPRPDCRDPTLKGEVGMSGKNVCLFPLLLTLASAGALSAQGPGTPAYEAGSSTPPPAEAGQSMMPPGAVPVYGLSRWILYTQPDCCGPLVDRVPMRCELYLRAGPAFPIEGPIFGQTLDTGWTIQGGGRVLFFDPSQTRAWILDLSLSNIHNNGRRPDVRVPINVRALVDNPNFNPFIPVDPVNNPQQISTVLTPQVSIRSLNRTFVNLAVGREWYLVGDASGSGSAWRVGVDGGGSWGSGKVEFHQINHRDDVMGRAFAAIHSDLDIPWGGIVFQVGARAEWSYTWSDVLQIQNNADVQDILIMGGVGFRF